MSHKHSFTGNRIATRLAVRNVECPFCGAEPSQRCLGKTYADGSRYIRSASHAQRWEAYRQSLKLS